MRISEACECGGALKVHGIEGDPSITAAAEAWAAFHQGPGHERISPAEATRIRELYRQRSNGDRPTFRPTWSVREEINA